MNNLVYAARRLCFVAVVLSCVCINEAHSKNLIENSSFEAGLDYRFGISRWYIDGLPGASLDTQTVVHGRYSLKLPYSRLSYTPAPRVYDGIAFRSAIPIAVKSGVRYTFSVYLKSDTEQIGYLVVTTNGIGGYKGKEIATRKITTTKKWRRVQLSFKPDSDQEVYWEIKVRSEKPGNLWIDALQMEASKINDYKPAFEVESGLTSNQAGKIFSPADPPHTSFMAYNNSKNRSEDLTYIFDVHDVAGKLVSSQTKTMSMGPESGISKTINFPVNKHGVYKATVYREGSHRVDGELNFSLLPERRHVPVDQSAFGAYTTIALEPLEIMSRLGMVWIGHLTSNTRMFHWNSVEPVEGSYRWYDDDMDLARDFGIMFNLDPCHTPKWAQSLSREERIRKWARFVKEMVRHYGDSVRHWTVGDEVHDVLRKKSYMKSCWTDAAGYADWHRAGYEAIKSVDPDASVILNTNSDFAEKIFRTLDPEMVDVLAVNSYHNLPLLKKMKRTADKNNIGELWAPGVAVQNYSFYRAHRSHDHSRGVKHDYWSRKNRELVSAVLSAFALDYSRLFHYTATYVGNANYNFSLFEADSGLKPLAVQFGALIWLLDGFSSARQVETRWIEKPLDVYRVDRHDGTVVFGLVPPQSGKQLIRITRSGSGDIILYDHFANSLPVNKSGDDILIQVGRDPVFISVPAGHADKLEKDLGTASVSLSELPDGIKRTVAGRYAIVHGARDNISRSKPGISLWYKTGSEYWIEVLRYRSSHYMPDYRVSDTGFEIGWKFTSKAADFYLGPGEFPPDLVDGATYYRSRRTGDGQTWDIGTIVPRHSTAVNRKSQTPPKLSRENLQHPAHLIRLANGLGISLSTTVTDDDRLTSNTPPAGFDNWDILTNPQGECFLHKYFKNSSVNKFDLRIKVSIMEQ